MSEHADPQRMAARADERRTAAAQAADQRAGGSSNPFSTRRTRPGAIAYIFPPGETAAALVQRLHRNSWQGAIIGLHGSGKTTLLCALLPEIESAGRKPVVVTLHDGERSLAAYRDALAAADAETLLVIDGYEQLSRLSRWRLRRQCKSRGCGLLVTAHASVGLPPLATTAVDFDTALAVVRALLAKDATVDRATVERAWHAHGGNLREVLFDLYDLHELRRLEGR